MISTTVIHTTVINESSEPEDLIVQPINCVSTMYSDFKKIISHDVAISNFCTIEANYFKYRTPSTLLTNSAICSASMAKRFNVYADIQLNSGMSPSSNTVILGHNITFNTESTCTNKAVYYRKGKPSISFNKYSIRRANGVITILKDAYI